MYKVRCKKCKSNTDYVILIDAFFKIDVFLVLHLTLLSPYTCSLLDFEDVVVY